MNLRIIAWTACLGSVLVASGTGAQAGALWQDTFNATGTPNTYDINYNNATRQAGSSLGVIHWTGASGNIQVGNALLRPDGQYMVVAGNGGSIPGIVSPDFNFNNATSEGGLNIEFDINPNIAQFGYWLTIGIGKAAADRFTTLPSPTTHFSLLFVDTNGVAAIDGAATAGSFTPAAPGVYGGSFSHVRLRITDPTDGNPFDGTGQTKIEVFTNNATTSAFTYTKTGGGYANNYINFSAQPGTFGGIDNLVISPVGEIAPRLKIIPSSPGNATLSWAPPTPGYVLQESLSLAPDSWTNSASGGTNPVVVSTGPPGKFFRLIKP